MAREKESERMIQIPEPDIRQMKATIIGDTPLVVHRFPEKARKEMEAKQAKLAKKARPKREPEQEFNQARYTIKKGVDGWPANGVKLAMVNAIRYVGDTNMTFAKGLFFVWGPDAHRDMLIITSKPPKMRTDIVRVPPGPKGAADMRYRPEYTKWSIDLIIGYNADLLSAQQLLNLLDLAGMHVGIGEMRPGAPVKSGTNGMFKVKRGKVA